MIVRPMFNLVLLPDVNYYFKNDFLKDWSLFPIEEKDRHESRTQGEDGGNTAPVRPDHAPEGSQHQIGRAHV